MSGAWRVGDGERNDGLPMPVAPGERQTVKDEDAKIIIEAGLLPRFRQGASESGLNAAVDSLVREVSAMVTQEAA
ncbi:MAG: hypothetical protein ACOCYR_02205 [Erythrobacter sp.]